MLTKYTEEYNKEIAEKIEEIVEKIDELRKLVRSPVAGPKLYKENLTNFLTLETIACNYHLRNN